MQLRNFLVAALAFGAAAVTPLAAQTLTLEEAVKEALAHNQDLTAERLTVNVAETRGITARLRPNPVLTVAGQTLNILGAHFTPDTPLGPNQFNFHTEVPLERGGKRQERIALAAEEKTAVELGVRETARRLVAAVQASYVDVQQARLDLNLARENLKSLGGIVTINEARVKSGDLAVVELERSRVAALQYSAAVQQAELRWEQAKAQLSLLLGRKEPSPALDVTTEMRRDDGGLSPEQLTQQAFARRPDYLGAKQEQARSRADLRLQLANGKVDYSIGAEFTRQSAWGRSGNSAGIYFSIPLPFSNRNQGEIARAEREIALNSARTQALETGIRSEVDRAYRNYAVSRQLLMNIESDMIGKARQVRDITEYSYRRGEASLIEFLDAQRAFNDATQSYIEAQANYARSLYLLDAVSGRTGTERDPKVP